MAAPKPGSYHGVSQAAGMRRPWWGRVPQPIVAGAVKIWSLLPHALRTPLIPFGRLINSYQTTATTVTEGPDTVDGVADLRAQGFEPIEQHTGAIGVAELWPEGHRRWVSETREAWLDDTNYDGRLWLVRSPWPSLSLADTLNVLWTWGHPAALAPAGQRGARVGRRNRRWLAPPDRSVVGGLYQFPQAEPARDRQRVSDLGRALSFHGDSRKVRICDFCGYFPSLS